MNDPSEMLATSFLKWKFTEGEETPSLPILGKVTYDNLDGMAPEAINIATGLLTEFAMGCIDHIISLMAAGENGFNEVRNELNEERIYFGMQPLPGPPMEVTQLSPVPDHIVKGKPNSN